MNSIRFWFWTTICLLIVTLRAGGNTTDDTASIRDIGLSTSPKVSVPFVDHDETLVLVGWPLGCAVLKSEELEKDYGANWLFHAGSYEALYKSRVVAWSITRLLVNIGAFVLVSLGGAIFLTWLSIQLRIGNSIKTWLGLTLCISIYIKLRWGDLLDIDEDGPASTWIIENLVYSAAIELTTILISLLGVVLFNFRAMVTTIRETAGGNASRGVRPGFRFSTETDGRERDERSD